MNKQLVIFKTVQKQQIRLMKKLNNLMTQIFSEEASGDPKDLDSEESIYPEAPVSNDRSDSNTHRTPGYLMTMDTYVENIDKDDEKTRRKIYQEIDEPYFVKAKLPPTQNTLTLLKTSKRATKYSI